MDGFLYNFVTGFLQGLCYTIMSFLFLLFIKKWYFKFIDKNLYGGKYYFENENIANVFLQCPSRCIKVEKKCTCNTTCNCGIANVCDKDYHKYDDDLKISLVMFTGDLRLKVKNKKEEFKIIIINKHLVPPRMYWDIYIAIVKNIISKKINSENTPVLKIDTCSKLEKIFTDRFLILEHSI